jgi:hypothetical protein
MQTYHISDAIFNHHESEHDFITDSTLERVKDNLIMDISHTLNGYASDDNEFYRLLNAIRNP